LIAVGVGVGSVRSGVESTLLPLEEGTRRRDFVWGMMMVIRVVVTAMRPIPRVMTVVVLPGLVGGHLPS